MEIPIMIWLYTAQKWLYKLGYQYKNIYKDMFINRHEQSNIIKNYKVFFNKIKKLKPYIIEFDKDSIIKYKVYFSNCIVKGNNW